jgi:hypothetical protein
MRTAVKTMATCAVILAASIAAVAATMQMVNQQRAAGYYAMPK